MGVLLRCLALAAALSCAADAFQRAGPAATRGRHCRGSETHATGGCPPGAQVIRAEARRGAEETAADRDAFAGAAASRRSAVQGAVGAAVGVGMGLGQVQSAAGAEGAPSSLDKRFTRFFTKFDERTKQAALVAVYNTYPPAFVSYLARLLLLVDPVSRQWWESTIATLPVSFDSSVSASKGRAAFRDYALSVQAGLENYEGQGGPRRLLLLLQERYGREAESAFQLLVLFSLLNKESQPTQQMLPLLQRLQRDGSSASAAEPGFPGFGVGTTATAAEDAAAAAAAGAGKGAVAGTSTNVVRLLSTRDVSVEAIMAGDEKVPLALNETIAMLSRAGGAPGLSFRLRTRFTPLDNVEEALADSVRGGDLRHLKRDVPLNIGSASKFFAAGALCSSLARLSLTPIDVVKTKLQAQANAQGAGEEGPGFVGTVREVLDRDGVRGLFAGADATVLGYFFGGACAFGMTELLKRRVGAVAVDLFGLEAVQSNPIPVTIVASATAMAMAVVIVMPFEAIRIRSVSNAKYQGGFVSSVKRIYAEEGGVGAFFSGLPFFLLKEVPFFIVKFVIFDSTVKALLDATPGARDAPIATLAISAVSGLIAGGTAAIFTHPADSLLTLANVRNAEEEGAGGLGSTLGYVKGLGPKEATTLLLGGLGPRLAFAGLAVSVQFFLYDAIKAALGITVADLSLWWDVLGGVSQQASS